MPNFSYRQVSGILSEWGRKNQTLPANNNSLKENALLTLRPVEQATSHPKNFRLFGGMLAAAAGVCVLLLFVFYTPKPKSSQIEKSNLSATAPYSVQDQAQKDFSSAQGLSLENGSELGLGTVDNKAVRIARKIDNYIHFSAPAPINDTREFLKVGYNADIKTRNTEKLDRQIQTMIRGYDGRIDRTEINSDYADIRFVIPKTSLEQFKNELRDLMPDRFYSERISSVNLLPQKQAVEKQTTDTNDELATLKARRNNLIAQHNKTINSYQRQIEIINGEITNLKQEVATDTVRQQEISQRIASLNSQKAKIQQDIANENSKYRREISYIDSNIKNTRAVLNNLKDEDQKILNNVETVECSIYLERISILEMIHLYIPIYWIVIILGALFVFYLLFGRQQRMIITP